MSEVQLISSGTERNQWRPDELELALEKASSHVRFLLHELALADEVPLREMKSQRVAYAQVQRICNSRGKDALVLSREVEGEKRYRINPEYRPVIGPLVATASPPPPSEPKPPREKAPRAPRQRRMAMSALDGIADSRPLATPARRISQTSTGRTLPFPEGVTLDFCQELMSFLNATASGPRYRIILEADGYRLEAC